MESRSSTPDTRIFRPMSPVVPQEGIEPDVKSISQDIDRPAQPATGTSTSRPTSDSPEPSSSLPPSPTTALHSHPTSAGPSLPSAKVLRKRSAESLELKVSDDYTERLSTIPEVQSPCPQDKSHLRTSTADSHKPSAPNFSRPFSAREGLTHGATSTHRSPSSESISNATDIRDESIDVAEATLRPESQQALRAASGSSLSKNAKYSSRSLFAFPIDDHELRSGSPPQSIGNSSDNQSDITPDNHKLRHAPTEGGPKPRSDTSLTASLESKSAALRLVSGSDEGDTTSASSGSMASRRYPPSLSSEYAAASAQNGSARATKSKERSLGNERIFTASNYDTSELSEKKLQKLRKKGIDPALHLEMKAAKGTGGKFGHVLGHAPL